MLMPDGTAAVAGGPPIPMAGGFLRSPISRFDPLRVGKLGYDAIRGRRAQKPCPCPRLLTFHPFGVQTNPQLIVAEASESTAAAR